MDILFFTKHTEMNIFSYMILAGVNEIQQVPVIGAIDHKVVCHQIPKHNTQKMGEKSDFVA